ncbi:MerR family DNA-binding transcriptional regulator, partial [Porticoccus hydrocarbonoclasticus]
MTIGSLAKAAEINVETIRYYQRLGLMTEPEKPLGGIRRYDEDALARLR